MDYYKVEALGNRRFVIEVPAYLENLQGPSEGIIRPPVSLFWQGKPVDLSIKEAVSAFYGDALSGKGSLKTVCQWINKDLLLNAWPDIKLNRNHKIIWEYLHPQLRTRKVTKISHQNTQDKVADTILPAIANINFALGGGGVLKEVLLFERMSKDIDSYTDKFNAEIFNDAINDIFSVCKTQGWDVTLVQDKNTFKSFSIEVDGEPVILDLGYDHRNHAPDTREQRGLRLSFPDLVIGKARALVGRQAARDFYDIAAIVDAGYSLDYIKNCLKEGGLQDYVHDFDSIIKNLLGGMYDADIADAGFNSDAIKQALRRED